MLILMSCMYHWLFHVELIWVILQVEEGGVLAVTQLLSNFSADIGPAAASAMPVDNPFMSSAAAATAVLPHVPVNDTVISCSPLPASCTTDIMPRHSSLPSSPRWFGESTATSTSPMLIPSEPLRARAVLFQVCNVVLCIFRSWKLQFIYICHDCIHCHDSDKQCQILTEFWTNNAMSNCKQITKFK